METQEYSFNETELVLLVAPHIITDPTLNW